MQILFSNDKTFDIWFVYYGLDPVTGKPAHMNAAGEVIFNVPSTDPTDTLAVQVISKPFNFPMLNAARLYISFGKPLLFTIDSIGNPIPPRAADSTDPNYNIPWDFFEVTYIPSGSDGLFNFNLSNVQSANIPLAFHVSGLDPSTRQPVKYDRGWFSGGYREFLESLRLNPDFNKLILPETYRVLAPGTVITAYKQKVISNPLFDEDYFKYYIELVWVKFESNDLIFVGDPPAGSNDFVTWTGRVQNGQFVFVTDDLPSLDPIVLNPPTTSDLFENNDLFFASGQGEPGSIQRNYANQLFGTLCAAFNRSIMLLRDTLANSADCAWCKAKQEFYQDSTTNHYSKNIHKNMIDGLAYAFQSDDHCDVSSFVSVINPDRLIITFPDE